MNRTPIAIAATLVALCALPQPGSAEPVAVHIVSRVGDRGPASDVPKRATRDQGVTLHAVVETRTGRERHFYSDAEEIEIGGRVHKSSPLSTGPVALWVWLKVEPTSDNLSNTASGKFRFEPIEYRPTLVKEWIGDGSVAVDVRPTLTPDYGHGVGTMRYQLLAFTSAGMLETPGTEARRGTGSGGLRDTVHRVSLRRDNTYLGYLTEMYGQPYIWASGGTRNNAHQSERLEGSDCADFVVYGKRRMGADIDYTWTGGMSNVVRPLSRGTPRADGVYVDDRGRPISFTRPGDLVFFPRHVGVLARDSGTLGVLDHQDVMMHTLFSSPREEPIGNTAYAGTWIEVAAWRR